MIRRTLIAGLVVTTGPAFANSDAVSGDAASGEALFVLCSGCHQVGADAVHGVGPQLNGVVGRPIGGADGFHYSPALQDSTDTWTVEALDAFLTNTTEFIYGTYMIIEGLDDPDERADLIAYLSTLENTDTPAGFSAEVEAILALPPDDAYGAYLSSECTSCHSDGAEGIPAIAGVPASGIIAGLVDYRTGARDHQVMNMIAGRLGDEEIAALAAFFATAE